MKKLRSERETFTLSQRESSGEYQLPVNEMICSEAPIISPLTAVTADLPFTQESLWVALAFLLKLSG